MRALTAALGGPNPVCARSNYSAGATSFVTTLPVSSDAALRPAAAAWEAAFVRLAAERLAPMAAAANLTLSYSTERSGRDSCPLSLLRQVRRYRLPKGCFPK